MDLYSVINSGEFRNTRWFPVRAAASAHLREAASSMRPRLFTVDGELYALHLSTGASSSIFEFTWAPCRCRLVPPLTGTATVRRLGPLTAVSLRAEYTAPNDAAGVLAHGALGKSLARRALEQASRAIAVLASPVDEEQLAPHSRSAQHGA